MDLKINVIVPVPPFENFRKGRLPQFDGSIEERGNARDSGVEELLARAVALPDVADEQKKGFGRGVVPQKGRETECKNKAAHVVICDPARGIDLRYHIGEALFVRGEKGGVGPRGFEETEEVVGGEIQALADREGGVRAEEIDEIIAIEQDFGKHECAEFGVGGNAAMEIGDDRFETMAIVGDIREEDDRRKRSAKTPLRFVLAGKGKSPEGPFGRWIGRSALMAVVEAGDCVAGEEIVTAMNNLVEVAAQDLGRR
jgi:hypothetical protein